jgi:hypothetical protein
MQQVCAFQLARAFEYAKAQQRATKYRLNVLRRFPKVSKSVARSTSLPLVLRIFHDERSTLCNSIESHGATIT